ncbi:uncharacterized protein [Cherax quadricarinatus]|uniref:uncharacterized protein isoform X2 n=1 Tax=Cherax quadricarinatus TaxID=27406 RepID=UPI002379769E|nr:uncharacterized protein LOC128700391 isoform X2 [Cherax quadricarinatus]
MLQQDDPCGLALLFDYNNVRGGAHCSRGTCHRLNISQFHFPLLRIRLLSSGTLDGVRGSSWVMASRFMLRSFSYSKKVSICTKMSSQVEAPQVVHDQENMEFYVKLGRDKAYLQYDIDSAKKIVDLQHTVVPAAFRGHGIGKVLAKASFEHFAESNMQMKLTCWYLKKYYQENPLPHHQEKVLSLLLVKLQYRQFCNIRTPKLPASTLASKLQKYVC